MIYKGHSPILAAVLVVILTTIVTMYLVGGASGKTAVAIAGTVLGVLISAMFALIFCKMTDISGYNVSAIESLIYVRDQTGIEVGQLFICRYSYCFFRCCHGCSNVNLINDRRNILSKS